MELKSDLFGTVCRVERRVGSDVSLLVERDARRRAGGCVPSPIASHGAKRERFKRCTLFLVCQRFTISRPGC